MIELVLVGQPPLIEQGLRRHSRAVLILGIDPRLQLFTDRLHRRLSPCLGGCLQLLQPGKVHLGARHKDVRVVYRWVHLVLLIEVPGPFQLHDQPEQVEQMRGHQAIVTAVLQHFLAGQLIHRPTLGRFLVRQLLVAQQALAHAFEVVLLVLIDVAGHDRRVVRRAWHEIEVTVGHRQLESGVLHHAAFFPGGQGLQQPHGPVPVQVMGVVMVKGDVDRPPQVRPPVDRDTSQLLGQHIDIVLVCRLAEGFPLQAIGRLKVVADDRRGQDLLHQLRQLVGCRAVDQGVLREDLVQLQQLQPGVRLPLGDIGQVDRLLHLLQQPLDALLIRNPHPPLRTLRLLLAVAVPIAAVARLRAKRGQAPAAPCFWPLVVNRRQLLALLQVGLQAGRFVGVEMPAQPAQTRIAQRGAELFPRLLAKASNPTVPV